MRRCNWANNDLAIRYHDEEWGVPIHDDRRWFELLVLEGAQAGLSWDTILKKRDRYRQVFDQFDPAIVARYDGPKVESLLADAGIIRNRHKISSAIKNAQAFLNVQREFGSFDAFLWRFVEVACDPPRPQDDPRSVGELISAILSGPDEDLAWDAVGALQWRGTHEVLDRAVRLCRSLCAVERRVGTDILGQLGIPDRTFPGPCFRTLLSLLEGEKTHDVLVSILVALSHLGKPEAMIPASRFRRHCDPDVRHAVVLALTGHEDPRAIDFLIELTGDPEAHVRDWATFALGSQVGVDTPDLRGALVDRLDDEDDDTRAEAIIGLARRGDRRIIRGLSGELALDSVGRLAVEAAALIGDQQLHAGLITLEDWWDVDVELLGRAIRACSPRTVHLG